MNTPRKRQKCETVANTEYYTMKTAQMTRVHWEISWEIFSGKSRNCCVSEMQAIQPKILEISKGKSNVMEIPGQKFWVISVYLAWFSSFPETVVTAVPFVITGILIRIFCRTESVHGKETSPGNEPALRKSSFNGKRCITFFIPCHGKYSGQQNRCEKRAAHNGKVMYENRAIYDGFALL